MITMHLLVVLSVLVAAASAQYLHYPYAYGLHGLHGVVGLKSAPCVNAANVPVPCAAGKKKREAQADPALLYGAYGYAHVPFGSSTGLDPITQGLDASTQGYAPYAHYGYGY